VPSCTVFASVLNCFAMAVVRDVGNNRQSYGDVQLVRAELQCTHDKLALMQVDRCFS
jgi:hypothetical protein